MQVVMSISESRLPKKNNALNEWVLKSTLAHKGLLVP